MKRLAGVFAVVSLALTGCGGSLCQDLADSVETLNEKAKPCGATSSPSLTDAEIKTCEDNIDKCTDSDKKALKNFNDCIGKLATCSTGSESTFAVAVLACGSELDKVSDACNNATSSSAKRTVARYSANVSR